MECLLLRFRASSAIIFSIIRSGGEIGIHVSLRCLCRKAWGFESPPEHHLKRRRVPTALFSCKDNAMKANVLTALAIAAVFSGCETLYSGMGSRSQEKANEAARLEMQRQQTAHDVEIAKASAASAERQIDGIDSRLARLEAMNPAREADVAVLRSRVDALERDNAMLREKCDKMRDEIADDISGRVAKMLEAERKRNPPPVQSVSQGSGYNHTVRSGETLSAIAQAYGVSVSKIKSANNLKSDVIRVDQVLFIPD